MKKDCQKLLHLKKKESIIRTWVNLLLRHNCTKEKFYLNNKFVEIFILSIGGKQ